MDMKLILGPDDGGVDDEADRVALRRLAIRALEERSRAPRRVQIVRRLRRLQERVLDADDLSRRRQDQVVQQRRAQDHVAALLAIGEIDFQARKGSAGQLEVGDAGLDDRPQRQAVESGREGCERRHGGEAGGDQEN